MALQIIGKLYSIGSLLNIQTKNGSSFQKRELIIDCSRYDTYTGEQRPNFVQMETIGQKCGMLDNFSVGDTVRVSFSLSGNKYTKDNAEKVFTKIVAYDVEMFDGAQQSKPTQTAQTAQPVQQVQPVQVKVEDNRDILPF